MIRIALIGLALLYLAIPAKAQDVQMRSGEHETFTRLTLALPTRLNWTIEPVKDGAVIRFGSDSLNIDTSFVFQRIPRDRLTQVSWDQAGNALQLGFGCDCGVTGFWHSDTMLVLDVAKAPKPDTAQTIQTSNNTAVALPLRASSHAADLLLAELGGDTAQRGTSETAVDRGKSEGAIDEARDRLLRQFSRAASQGLISPRQTLPDVPQRNQPATPQETWPEPTQVPANLPPQINLRAQSSIDMDFLGALPAPSQNVFEQGCLPSNKIDVGSWGNDAPFGAQISPLRLRLTGEFDDTNPDVATELAKAYIFFAFGAEARNILNMVSPDAPGAPLLLQLADIAEQGFAKNNSYLANQMDCDSPAALWSALSYQELPRDLPIDGNAILRAFSALPLHLRTHYGPILSRRFLDAGQTKIANQLLRILDRADQTDTPEEEMAKAQADKMAGNIDLADDRLERVVDGNSQSAAEALVELIEERVNRGDTVSFEQAQLVAAYGFEKQNEPIFPALKAAHIRALAASDAFDRAFETFHSNSDVLNPEDVPSLRSDLIRILSDTADDMTFLHHGFAGEANHPSELEPAVANKAAQRLFDLGFPDEAARVIPLSAPLNSETRRPRQLLRAEIALAQGAPRQAIVELLDLSGPDVNLLRARALSAAGDHAAAFHLFASAEQPGMARQEAWLQGDWDNAGDPTEPAYEALAEIRNTSDEIDEAALVDQAELARNRALVEASSSTRNTVTSLLAANPLPEDVLSYKP